MDVVVVAGWGGFVVVVVELECGGGGKIDVVVVVECGSSGVLLDGVCWFIVVGVCGVVVFVFVDVLCVL